MTDNSLKKQLRQQLKQRLSEASDSWLKESNRQLLQKAANFLENFPDSLILAWYPFFNAEPDLLDLQQQLNKKFYFPRISDRNKLNFYNSENYLADGASGLIQPEEDSRHLLNEKTQQPLLCLIPGLAFDRNGNRLGRGAGMYDRFLEKIRKDREILAVGVCWSFQILPTVESQSHDQSVNAIVTEKESFVI